MNISLHNSIIFNFRYKNLDLNRFLLLIGYRLNDFQSISSTTCDIKFSFFRIIFHSVSDLNECNQGRPCQHICINTYGSYRCQCYSCYTKYGTRCRLQQCKINGGCYRYGAKNPYNQCQVIKTP